MATVKQQRKKVDKPPKVKKVSIKTTPKGVAPCDTTQAVRTQTNKLNNIDKDQSLKAKGPKILKKARGSTRQQRRNGMLYKKKVDRFLIEVKAGDKLDIKLVDLINPLREGV